ncbi:site-specific integrase [Enterococcus faecalis]|nr:site-specific integrase [Enterococcus faecalis]
MATVIQRKNSCAVIYRYIDLDNSKKQKWDSCATKAEANKRKKFVEYYQSVNGLVLVPNENGVVKDKQECQVLAESSVKLNEFLDIYVEIYGQANWSVTTYRNKESLIKNYINPLIGEVELEKISTRLLSKFYIDLLKVEEIPGNKPATGKLLQPANVKKIHDLIRSALTQAIAWEYLPISSTNPAKMAVLPKIPKNRRKVWEIDTFKEAVGNAEDDLLRLCMHLAFACSLRIGEILGLTWDNLVIDELAIQNGNSRLIVEKQLSRVSKEAVKQLREKDIIKIFPSNKVNTTCVVLMTPKTESSCRTVWIPQSVANMLVEHRRKQESEKIFLGSEYKNSNLVIALENGNPVENRIITKRLKKLCRDFDLPKVEFHSLRHLSTNYKLKMTKGDIKSVQGDTGHSNADMVTDVYTHIIDEDRKMNAKKLNDAFYDADIKSESSKEELENLKLLKIIQSLPDELKEKLLSLDREN